MIKLSLIDINLSEIDIFEQTWLILDPVPCAPYFGKFWLSSVSSMPRRHRHISCRESQECSSSVSSHVTTKAQGLTKSSIILKLIISNDEYVKLSRIEIDLSKTDIFGQTW